MDRPLFTYGTLCDADLLAAVLGRIVDRRNVMAGTAPGYRVVHYPGRIYPALVKAPGGVAPGLVVLGLSALDRAILDAYEGEEYRRGIVPVIVDVELHEAEAFLPTVTVSPAEAPWTLEVWQARHKTEVFAGEAAAAAEIRAALAARRLH